MTPPHTCSVVIPVYNSAEGLPDLIASLEAALPKVCADFEVILVNDGSRDRSWEAICQLGASRPWLCGVNLMRNYGQHNALLCGIRQARCEIIVTMDDDLQHPPEEIGKLLDKLDEGYDVAYGSPRKMPHSLMRNAFSFVTKRTLSYVMGIPTVRELGAFRAFRASLVKAFAAYNSPTVIIDVLLSWGTTRFAAVYVDQEPRRAGHSNYNFFKLFSVAMLILTGFSTTPLRVANLLGFCFTLFGLAVLIHAVSVYFQAGSVPGFPFLASTISIFSGIQLFALGIIGEYLARMFDRSMERPPYVVDEIQGEGKQVNR
jgi:undecaprenyl-phosphate 4-deoxy-4-formamido-L-arabinose transferase